MGCFPFLGIDQLRLNISLPNYVGPGHPAVHVALRSSPQERERNNRGTLYMPHMENGISITEHLSASMAGNAFSMAHGNHRSPASLSHQSDRVVPSPVIVSSRYVFTIVLFLCVNSTDFLI